MYKAKFNPRSYITLVKTSIVGKLIINDTTTSITSKGFAHIDDLALHAANYAIEKKTFSNQRYF